MSLIDLYLPHYQFVERHALDIAAPPGRVLDIILSGAVSGAWIEDDGLVRGLVRFRFLLDRLMQGAGRLDWAPSFSLQSFTFLGREGDREVAVGLAGRFWRLTGALVPTFADASHFMAFAEPGVPKLVINFQTAPAGDLTRLSTETRVFCPDRRSRILMTPYWFAIRLVSGFMRRRFLTAVKRSAERERLMPD